MNAGGILHDAAQICCYSNNQYVRMNAHCASRNEVLLYKLERKVEIEMPDGRIMTMNPNPTDGNGHHFYLVIKKYNSANNDTAEQRDKAVNLARNEYNLLMDNQHRNIVEAFGLYEPDVTSFTPPELYMECGDYSVYQVLFSTNLQSNLQQRMAWALQAAKALKFLHDRRVIHRDVKSHNMLLFNRGTLLKLCDLEFSRQVDDTMTTERGTWCWMAPEMLLTNTARAKYNFKIDCWSFAMTLYEMLFQKIPFEGCDVKKTLRGESDANQTQQQSPLTVYHSEIDNARTIRIDWQQAKFQDLPEELKEAVNKLLVYDPDHRSDIKGAITRLEDAGFNKNADEVTEIPQEVSDTGSPCPSAAQLERNAGTQMVTPPNRIEVTISVGSDTRRSRVTVRMQPEQDIAEENMVILHEILLSYRTVISDECRGLRYEERQEPMTFTFSGAEFDSEPDFAKINQLIYGETIRQIGAAVGLKIV